MTSTGAAAGACTAAWAGALGSDAPQATTAPISAVAIKALKLFDILGINVTLINRAYVYVADCKVRMNVRNNVAAQQIKCLKQKFL
jgi:hypothetical protein